jgi:hypothetical protein
MKNPAQHANLCGSMLLQSMSSPRATTCISPSIHPGQRPITVIKGRSEEEPTDACTRTNTLHTHQRTTRKEWTMACQAEKPSPCLKER